MGLRRAHPRVCGENETMSLAEYERAGSSPRVRGKLGNILGGRIERGLIPACAGKTSRTRRYSPARWAHPRVCGENYTPELVMLDEAGSSPRVRGKRPRRTPRTSRRRLIPACAGKTQDGDSPAALAGAHPRVCGENTS